jgi:putative aldouronate transport system permease protein
MVQQDIPLQSKMLARQADEPGKKPFRAIWSQHWMVYAMLIPAIVSLILFHLYPLWGISVAFVNYNPFKGVLESPFVGLANFERFFGSGRAWEIIRNTLVIAIGKITMGQLAGLVFALMLQQVRVRAFKRVVQSLTTLPHFISWVILGGIIAMLLSSDGPINQSIRSAGLPPISFLGDLTLFPLTLILSETWKEFGWAAVIYLAALTAINPELYEAAAVDGAGRWAQLWSVTIPGIAPTIALMSCLSLGGILSAGFEQVLVLINPIVNTTGEIIDVYVYRVGLLDGDFSFGAAVGLFKSVIGFFLVVLSYWLADRFANYRIL